MQSFSGTKILLQYIPGFGSEEVAVPWSAEQGSGTQSAAPEEPRPAPAG